MAKITSLYLRLLICLLFSIGMTACVDDFRPDFGEMDGSIRNLHIDVCFEPNSEAQISSRSNDGNAIQDIHSLRMLIYDKSGETLLRDYLIWNNDKKADTSGDISNESYDGKADNRLENEKNGNDALHDTESGKLSYDLKLPTGEYYIYAVANAESELAANDYSTRDKLKAIRCNWQTDRDENGILDLGKNSQMFGIYDLKENRSAYKEDKPVKITNASTTLHCWLRRLASKVTVAFDGTGLYDNVQVYIETITLRDIPKSCTLGNPNRAGQSDMSDPESRYGRKDMYNTDLPNVLIETGEQEVIQEIDHNNSKIIIPDNFIHVCNTAHPYLGKGKDGNDPEIIDRTHSHTAKSLFFYENIQGEGKDKRQDYTGPDGTPDGELDHPGLSEKDENYVWKDDKPFGTYIEVKGWYRCVAADGHVGDGPITYRFMLGKDELKDYNAERNTHYKLTLCLKGYGNDADWHIEYEHKRGLHVSSPQYISYLYNKKMTASVKISGEYENGAKLRAEIIEAGWEPWSNNSTAFPAVTPGFYWDKETVNNAGNWNSFLSLRQTKVIKVEDANLINVPSNEYSISHAQSISKNYYINNNIGWRVYDITPKNAGYESNETGQDGMYFVQELSKNGNSVTERLVTIPLYTRAKELVTKTGFTGNNPYTEYPRYAKVKFTLVKSDEVTPYEGVEPVELEIIQVRRIVNPKGIWRSKNNSDPFHVTLMRLPNEKSNFTSFNSEGKWSAEVITGQGEPQIITLSSTTAGNGTDNKPQNNVQRIIGESEHPIDFMINFTGNTGCAIVKIRYHNFTCEHDIYCRKGYEDPIDITGDNLLKWPSFNVAYFKDKEPVYTKSPLEEGSLFRRENYTAILAENNTADVIGLTPATLNIKDEKGADGTAEWANIKPTSNPINTDAEYNIKYSNWIIIPPKDDSSRKNERIARGEDFYTLIAKTANDINFKIGKAYGILYGDGATRTLVNPRNAYGYNKTDGSPDSCGMRGVFVYNNENCRQVFFPIGTAGHGHRKQKGWMNNDPAGALRYASRSEKMEDSSCKNTPLFYDLYERCGAIYWMEHFYTSMPQFKAKDENGKEKPYNVVSKSSAFDMNYFTMGFEGYGGNDAIPGNNTDNSHACFIRTVIPVSKSK